MTQDSRITTWLHHLRRLLPPSGAILVGAGGGASVWVRLLESLELTNVTLVEAEDTQFRFLQRSVEAHSGWRMRKDVVAATNGPVLFYQASIHSESGILDPESLRSFWPNIQTRQATPREAVALSEIQVEAGDACNWLIVDCLPAKAVVESAGPGIDRLDVVVARVIVEDPASMHLPGTQADLESFFGSHGFRLLETEPGRHPGFGHALYVRDAPAALRALQRTHQIQQIEVQRMAQAESVSKVQSSELRAEHAELKSDLERAKQEHEALLRALQSKTRELEAAADAQTLLAAEHSKQMAELAARQIAADTLVVERNAELEKALHRSKQLELLVSGSVETQAELELKLANAMRSHEELVRALQSRTQELEAAGAAQALLVTEHSRQAAEWVAVKDAADRLAAERHVELEIASQGRQQSERLAQECRAQCGDLAGQIERLEVELAQVTTGAQAATKQQLAALQDEAKKKDDERIAQLGQLSQAQAAALKLAGERARTIEQLKQAATESEHLLTKQKTQIDSLQQTKANLEKELANRQRECDGLRLQVQQATAALEQCRLEVVSELESVKLHHAAALDETQQGLVVAQERTRQLEGEIVSALAEGARLETANTTTLNELSDLKSVKDEAERIAEALRKQTVAQEVRIKQLEGELPEANRRQKLLEAELTKAAGQIELISNLLLRDRSV